MTGYEKGESGPGLIKKIFTKFIFYGTKPAKRVDLIMAVSGGKMDAFVRINRMETLNLLCLDGLFVVVVTSNGGG